MDARVVRRRPEWTVRAEMLTWELCVLRIEHGTGSFVVCLAGDEFERWLDEFDRGHLDGRLRRLERRPPRRPLRRVPPSVRRAIRRRPAAVGIEYEFEVHHGTSAIDFPRLMVKLDVPGVAADPCDPRAHRTSTGVITADGREAEIATPPITIRTGFAVAAVESAERATAQLQAVLPPGYHLVGVSTHINVSWNVRRDAVLARRWAAVFAPALMLLLDRPTSPGLLVRPRPGRLELGGEYCTGARLAAAVAFAAASVRAIQTERHPCRSLAVDVQIVPAVARFGWYVDRSAFGSDLYADGRNCRLTRSGGEHVTAGAHLADVIDALSDHFRQLGAEPELDALRRTVAAQAPLPEPVGRFTRLPSPAGRR